MKLVIGLGNVGSSYTNTRHNIGFQVLDAFAAEHGAEWTDKSKFKATVTTLTIQGESILLAKPTTMYNLVGEAVQRVASYYNVDLTDILVVHDELMLPFGTVRTRLGGSDAGNNGLKSLHNHVGQDTARVRIGIYNELRDRTNDADFVLSQFSQTEQLLLPHISSASIEFIDQFVKGTFTPHTSTVSAE